MESKALFVEMEADPGCEEEVATFLRDRLEIVEREPHTRDWYAIRFDAAHFAIFDTFGDNEARVNHMLGPVGRSLLIKSFSILDGLPTLRSADVLSAKRSPRPLPPFALHVALPACEGKPEAIAALLGQLRPAAEAEPGTHGWYALRFGRKSFGIMSFFADEASRDAHLHGDAVETLRDQASLFAAPLAPRRGEVLASKVAKAVTLVHDLAG